MKKRTNNVKPPRQSTLDYSAFVFILLSGAALRLWGIGSGLPFIFHPDENRQVLDSFGMAARLSLLPEEFSYPALHKYLLLIVNGSYFVVGKISGWFSSPSDFALQFLIGNTSVFLLDRLLSVLAGVSAGLVVYRMSKDIHSKGAGIIAFAFSMGMFHLIQHSQWALADIFVALFVTASLWLASLSAERENDTRYFILAALFAGLAVSTKPQGVLLAAPLAIARFYALKDGGFKIGRGFVRTTGAGLIVFMVCGLIGNLAWVFEFRQSLEKFRMLSQVAHLGISSAQPFEPGLPGLALWFCKELVRQEGPLGAALIAGVAFAAFKRKRSDLVMLSYIAVFLFTLKDWAIRYLHLFVAIFPVMTVLGARALHEWLARARAGAVVSTALAAAIVLPSVAGSIEVSVLKGRPDTRLLAKAWIESNIEKNSAIAIDWYEFSVPLWTDMPSSVLNPKASQRYEKAVPEDIRRGYADFIGERPHFRAVPVIYSTPGPNWPSAMGSEAVAKASSKEVYRELYSVFNFRSIEELRNAGAKYLLISSYGYSNFLLDDDPAKTQSAAFNYLFREDLLGFNKQSDRYIDDGRFGLLFFLNKRARDFYVPLLRNSSQARLLKEFAPSQENPGPYIKIFRL